MLNIEGEENMRRNPVLYKSLVVGVIVLFIGMSVVSSTGNILKDVSVYKCSQEPLSCDHLAYIGDYLADCWLYEFILNDPGNLTCTCDEGSYFFSAGGTWTNDGEIITSLHNTVTLLEINYEKCDIYNIGGQGCNGLSMDPTTCRMFGVRGSSSGSVLYEVDHETGELSTIGDCGVTWMIGIAFDADGVLYGWSISQDCLYTIDTKTGEATVVGPLGINLNYASDGDFCMEDDILYLAADGRYLYECDEDTGNCNLIGQFQGDVDVSIFVIPWNYPPYEPSDPIPPDGAINWTGGGLCWTCSDPDGDDLTYNVYFGTRSPPPLVSSGQSATTYDPGTMGSNTTYYWRIVAEDEHCAYTVGPIWHFTTRENQPPDTPEIEGQRMFMEGEGGIYPYTIYSTDPDVDDVCYLINWSDGTEEWTGYYASGEEITINVTIPSEKGTYVIFKIRAEDILGAESDWATLEVIVPRTRASSYLWFLERFPLLERLLTFLLL